MMSPRPTCKITPGAATPVAAALAVALALGSAPVAAETTTEGPVQIEEIATGLSFPWGLAFLPDGRMLVTERDGALRVVADGRLSAPVRGVPDSAARGQGGLLDVALDPNFADNRTIYLSYSEPGRGGAGTAVARGVLMADEQPPRLSDVQVIFSMDRKSRGGRHFGSRLAFAPDGTLFVTIGDRGDADRAQEAGDHAGSVVRINTDGSIPADNPFRDVAGAKPELWSIGHRNPQSAAIHPQTGALWTVEHGARGGDEINIPEAGKNYGWPVISYGRHYAGGKIGIGTEAPGYEQPIHYWDPSIAPSGMTFYTGDLFPEWTGDLFVGALKERHLARLDLDGNRIAGEEQLLTGLRERIRDVRNGPDGALYVLTDSSEGRILRLTPAD